MATLQERALKSSFPNIKKKYDGSVNGDLATEHKNLADSLQYLNAAMTPETLQFVCGLWLVEFSVHNYG